MINRAGSLTLHTDGQMAGFIGSRSNLTETNSYNILRWALFTHICPNVYAGSVGNIMSKTELLIRLLDTPHAS
jgi:hypothetical protein